MTKISDKLVKSEISNSANHFVYSELSTAKDISNNYESSSIKTEENVSIVTNSDYDHFDDENSSKNSTILSDSKPYLTQ